MNKIKLERKTAKDVKDLLMEQPATVELDQTIDDVLNSTIEGRRTQHVYVVDSEKRLVGSIRMNTIVEYLFPYASLSEKAGEVLSGWMPRIGAKTAGDLMNTDSLAVEETTPLSDVARILMREKINELPIIDKQSRIVGRINMNGIIASYLNDADCNKPK